MMILAIFFLIGNIVALISQYSRYQKLETDAEKSKEPEEIAAFKSAQNKMIPNIVILVIGLISIIGLFFYYFSAPTE